MPGLQSSIGCVINGRSMFAILLFDRCAIAVRYVVGGFYRFHRGRGINENLNARGMQFVSLAFEDICLLSKGGAAGWHVQLVLGLWCDSPTGVTGGGAELKKSLLPASAISE
jgi:hypothetical protein